MATDIIARGMITEYKSGTNISFTENEDGSVTISASGDVSSEDTVARETIDNHKLDKNNPHNVTAEQVGLGNVDNTADLDKPISTAVQTALDDKANSKHTHKKSDITDFPNSLPANGGNADTVGGKSADDFAEYKPYAPIYKGDLLDIAEMGTYSCFAEEVTNLPPDIISACYVTMTRFRDAGYKQFVCSPLNLINANNHTLFLANETFKDSNGRLIWEKMFSSGNFPYIIGNVTVESGSSTANTDHNFMPSAVFWWEDKGAVYSATSFDTTSFNMAIASSVDRTINYIIFK